MSATKPSTYAPDIFKALNGVLLVYKPPRLSGKSLCSELKDRISDQLNQYEPRPIDKRIVIEGSLDEDKRIIERPNLADHPLVVGPRYLPWDFSLLPSLPTLGFYSSGLNVFMLGSAIKYLRKKLLSRRLVSIYHITGRFGYVTDTFLYDGKITDKATFKHVRPAKLDGVLARIESCQHDRMFDAASIQLNSREAYELAKDWPSRPPQMARWPVIYRIRCIHFKLPVFKLEVTVLNENERFLAQIPHDIAQMLKSAAYTESIRRVKLGPFDVNDSLTDKDWDLGSIIKHLGPYYNEHEKLKDMIRAHSDSLSIRSDHDVLRTQRITAK